MRNIQRLWVRLLGSHVLLVVVLTVSMGSLVVHTSQEVLRAAVLQGQQEVVNRTAQEIFYFIDQPINSLQALALAMNVEREAWQRQSLLSQVGLEWNPIDEVSLVDEAGYIRATSVLDVNAVLSRGQKLPTGYLPDAEDLWQMVLQRRIYFSDMILTGGQPSLIIGVPVEEGGKVVGALVARLNLYRIWEKIDHLKPGETGYSSLVDQQGRFIAHPARELVYRQAMHPQAAQFHGRSAGILQWKDGQGRAWVTGFAPIEELDWTVVVEQQADEAFSLIATLRQRLNLIVVLSIAGAVILGLLLLRTITRPLALLMKAVQGMQQGKLQHLELPRRQDELRELGEAFLEMSQMLAARQQELESSLAFERHLVEDNPVGIAVMDADFRIVQANKAWEDIFHAAQITGQPLGHTPGGQQLETWLKDHPGQREVNDLQIRETGGRTRFWNLKVVELAQGHPGRTLLVLEDKTQQRSLELQVMQSEKLAALGEMAAGVAHEIKNPLAIVQGVCDLLKRLGPDEREEQEKTLDILQVTIRRIDERIKELLDFARPSPHLPERLEVNAVLRQLLDLEHRHMEQRGIRLAADLCSTSPIYMNRDVLKDILLNLLTNALEAMPEGGELYVSTREVADQVVLQLRDTGAGIPADRLPRIFEPFYSTKPPGQGTGLRLAIVHRQLQEAGGRIQIASEEGRGTSVSVYLPAMREREGGSP